jgi:hypothetical protein
MSETPPPAPTPLPAPAASGTTTTAPAYNTRSQTPRTPDTTDTTGNNDSDPTTQENQRRRGSDKPKEKFKGLIESMHRHIFQLFEESHKPNQFSLTRRTPNSIIQRTSHHFSEAPSSTQSSSNRPIFPLSKAEAPRTAYPKNPASTLPGDPAANTTRIRNAPSSPTKPNY